MMSRLGDDDGTLFQATRMAELAGLTEFITRACARVGAGAEATADLRLATEEVFTNIMRHGYGDQPGPVTVRVEATPGRMAVTLVDAAPGFDPDSLPAPDIHADCAQREPGGLGWHLVRQVMDEVRREPGAQGGNVFTLVRNLQAPRRIADR